jgi:ligand-binding sensor domain-containing protein/two-component sensor histidine kinase
VKRYILPFTLFALLLIIDAQAQTFPVIHFTPSEGLAHDNVYRIFQDRKGFMWFGTEYGLSCYDGRRFTNYQGTRALFLNTITYVGETADEKKLLCTYSGSIAILDNDTLRRIHYRNDSIIGSAIQCLMDVRTMWIIDKSSRLFRCNDAGVSEIKASGVSSDRLHFRKLVKTRSGNIILGADEGLFIIDKDQSIQPYKDSPIKERIYTLDTANDGALWVGLADRVIRISGEKVKNVYTTGAGNEISDLLIDHSGRAWIAIPNVGVLLLRQNRFINITPQLKLQNILVNDIYEDRQHNIWIATHGSGLFCVSSMDMLLYPAESGMVNNYATVITPYGSKLYIGSFGTVSVADGESVKPLRSRFLQASDYIYFIKGYNKRLYIGTPRGLLIKDTANYDNEEFLNTAGAIAMNVDWSGQIWLSRFGDLGMLREKRYEMHTAYSFAINSRVNDILSDNKGKLYFIGIGGVFCAEKGIVKKIATVPDHIGHAIMDNLGRLWLSSEAGAYMLNNGKFSLFTTANGLGHDLINGFAEDTRGNIWIATLSGLDRYDGKAFQHFASPSNLISNEILSAGADRFGNVWAGTVNGILCIKDIEKKRANTSLRVYITSVHANGHNWVFPVKVSVPYHKNIQINFSAPDLPVADKVQYQYQIEGLGTDWQMVNTASLEIPSLPGGQYTVMVRARHRGESWGQPALMQLSVATPFWQQSWFIILSIILLITLIYLFTRWRISMSVKRQKEKAAIHDKMIYLKQQALAALINPHFVFNCLNSVQSYIHLNDKAAANKFLVNFARLIRMTLDYAQEAFISLDMELERLELYLQLEQLRFGDKLQFSIIMEPALYLPEIKIPNMILQPYVENAIKHGIIPKKQQGTVCITGIVLDTNLLKIIIEDDGVGLSFRENADKLHHSIGMKLTDERLTLLQQMHNKLYEVRTTELKDTEGNILGTRVELLLSLDAEIIQYDLNEIH